MSAAVLSGPARAEAVAALANMTAAALRSRAGGCGERRTQDYLTRNQVRFAGTQLTVPMLTEPTSAQREAFSLLGASIPLTLK